MRNYSALLGSFDQLGKVKDVSLQRDDRRGTLNEETAPADTAGRSRFSRRGHWHSRWSFGCSTASRQRAPRVARAGMES
ncbi:MAG: hypothetical protein M3Z22_02825, partial [Verrucomicrobiota bacterium]|nr:hypothetical protein [Verrucomicrobiota bacterium]